MTGDGGKGGGAGEGDGVGEDAALDWQSVASALHGHLIGREIVYLPVTTSTNDVARDLARAGALEGVAVCTDAQTAGRGRAGKSPWLTPAGTSIAVSVVLRPPIAPARLPVLSMAAGVAVVEAVRATTGVAAVLKWPNDVLAAGRKLGGVLLESALAGNRVDHVILGVGLNANFPAGALGALPDAAVPATTLLDEAGHPVAREEVLAGLLRALDRVYGRLLAGEVAPIAASYRMYLDTLGQAVRVSGVEGSVEGVAEDVTGEAALVVRLSNGERREFTNGEVSLRLLSRRAAP